MATKDWQRSSGQRDRERSRDGDDRRGDRRRPERQGREEGGHTPDANMERFRIEVGWRDRVKPGNIVGAIANESGLTGRSIGRIQIFDTHSTIDLPHGKCLEDVFDALRRLPGDEQGTGNQSPHALNLVDPLTDA